MAKLNIKVSMVVDTGPLVVHNHEKSKEETVKGKKLITMLSEADPEKTGVRTSGIEHHAQHGRDPHHCVDFRPPWNHHRGE